MREELFKKIKDYYDVIQAIDYLVAKGGMSAASSMKIKDEIRNELDNMVSEVYKTEEAEQVETTEEKQEEETTQEETTQEEETQ